MNKAFIIDDNVTLKEAAKMMSVKNIGSVLVVKDSKILGIITEKDVARNLNKLNSKVSSIMSRKVVTIEYDEELEDAATLMAENKIKRLPVMQNKKLVGIITATDIIAHAKDINEEEFMIN
ncbi:MAG: CBS domain-containing protein [Candidatus Pacearchaeota archaeon]